MERGTLLLVVTDGHWATRLRYQQKRLQRQLLALEAFANLTRIRSGAAAAGGGQTRGTGAGAWLPPKASAAQPKASATQGSRQR
jgi:hypothetical protein